MREDSLNQPEFTFGQKLLNLHWFLVFLICMTAAIGVAMLYSAANGSFQPWASRHMVRFGVGLVVMITIALIDVRIWLRYAYVFYGLSLVLLILVEIMGYVGMGAQRWLDLGYFNLQPSELMKIALVLALARYFHGLSLEDVERPTRLIMPLLMVFTPAGLVLRQPDLGTALMLILASGGIFFVAGVRIWQFALVIVSGLIAAPVGWQFLHEYQKARIMTFLNPEADPLGAGYHIIQSKIALGSGGMTGKGYMQGTQGHLNFLPEMQTDFIFTMLAEEFGLVGGLGLLAMYGLLLVYGVAIATRSYSQFGRLVAMGVTVTFFLYVFINIAMVMGLIPVVGVPLPLISYGGTAMMTLLIGFGLLIGVWVHRDVVIGRRGGDEV
ncbi:MAG: rod shape-determining protein RodA [Rhodospirillaceae bacterium]|nr:rod shape-determining protein RodA [Rhodospirillaceae bacterium]MBT5297057.1 rod shape-determining protein RodA [Rhodospirillaceae bacterium]MBT5515170.1 rod shape-determining protein RodA [Rhodospirillaceae bacterium]